MLVVVDAKTVEADTDTIKYCDIPEIRPVDEDLVLLRNEEVETETIRGIPFYHPEHGKIFIGWSKKVEKEIGIPLQAIKDKENQLDWWYEEYHKEKENKKWWEEKAKYEKNEKDYWFEKAFSLSRMGFLGRLAFLFMPKKVSSYVD